MARIRSIHPSFFTDEAVVSCGPLARILYVGLWTDADDQGLFEWKPLQIKMRLLPGDNADAGALLDELTDAGLIAELTAGGKRLGAIRDFRAYQRPKKPNAVHVLPVEWRTFVGLGDASSEEVPSEDDNSSEPVGNQFGTGSEKPSQMEDGGEDEGKRKNGTSSLLSDRTPTAANDDVNASTALVLSGEPAPAKRGKAKADPTPAEREEFEAFWAVYPRKAGKQQALSAYVAALRSGVRADDIFVGAQGYAGLREGQDPAHTKMAQGWLNDKRWTDEIASPPQGGYRDQRFNAGWDPMQQAIDGIDLSKDFAA